MAKRDRLHVREGMWVSTVNLENHVEAHQSLKINFIMQYTLECAHKGDEIGLSKKDVSLSVIETLFTTTKIWDQCILSSVNKWIRAVVSHMMGHWDKPVGTVA